MRFFAHLSRSHALHPDHRETQYPSAFQSQRLHFPLAPEVGLEPTTTRLTVACSTIELLRNRLLRDAETTGRGFYGKHFLHAKLPRARV